MSSGLIPQLLRRLLLALVLVFVAPATASALTISLSAPTLQFTPAGPYATGRDVPVGTVLATASSTLNFNGLSGTCNVTAVFLSSSLATGNTYSTGVAGLGVNLYYVVGGTQTQITPGINLSLLVTTATPAVSVQAQLVVTGAVGTGTLSALPSVGIVFAGVGLGCGILNVTAQTLNVTSSNISVTGITCVVATPSLNVALPTVSVQTLTSTGKTGGATNFTVLLNCGGSGSNVYVTLSDATLASNATNLLTLTPLSTATNVKIQILNANGTPVSYGPDSPSVGNLNQFLVGSSGTVSSVPMVAQYYATGPVGAGTVFALATFTLSYQ